MFIAACWGDAWISRAIQVVSARPFGDYPRWGPSHLALILKPTPSVESRIGDSHVWVESSTLIPRKCCLAGSSVSGLQCHRIQDRWTDYRQGHIQLYQLAQPLTAWDEMFIAKLIFDGWFKVYPRTTQSRMKRLLFQRDDVPLCSEFVKDAVVHLGHSKRTDSTWYSPADFIREHLKAGIIIPV